MSSSITRFLLKTALLLAGIIMPFALLYKFNYLPVITTSTLFDTKMMMVQKHPIDDAEILAIGSSITLYELDSRLLVETFHRSYYNFASWGLQMGDDNLLLQTLTPQYHPRYVIICSSFGDFISAPNPTYHNYTDAPLLMRRHLPELFYFKNFSSMRIIIHRKQNAYPVNFDDWGGAKLKVNPRNDTHKKLTFPTAYTPAAYRSLDSLAARLHHQNIKLIFIQVPARNAGIDSATTQRYRRHFKRCQDIVDRNQGTYLNFYNPAAFPDSLFADGYHLKPEGSQLLSQKIMAGLKNIINPQ